MSGWNASSEPVEAILFDLGNTLVSYYNSIDFQPILTQCVRISGARLDARRDDCRQVDFPAAQARAVICNRERPDHRVWPLAERLAEVFALEPDDPLLDDDLAAAFLAPIFATARLDSCAVSTLRALRRLGLKTAIVSNTPWGSPARAWRAELARHGLLDAVDVAVFCVEVGWRKPARAPFARALELLGMPPGRAWFVGDDAIWDMRGAREAGMTPILLGQSTAAVDCRTVQSLSAISELLIDRTQ